MNTNLEYRQHDPVTNTIRYKTLSNKRAILQFLHPPAPVMNKDMYYYYIEMTNECNHPSNKIVLTQEGEYVCTLCGVVLTLDQAAERRVYAQKEAVGYIDPKGKTNPWLLGLGSTISTRTKEGKRLAEIARKYNVDGSEYSKFANVLSYLNLETYGNRLINIFKSCIKNKQDPATSAYIAIMTVINDSNLDLDSKKIREVINDIFDSNVKFIPSVKITKARHIAKHYGAKEACRLLVNNNMTKRYLSKVTNRYRKSQVLLNR